MQLLFSDGISQCLHLGNRKQTSHGLKQWCKSPEALYALPSQGIKLFFFFQIHDYRPYSTSISPVSIHGMVKHSLFFYSILMKNTP